MHCRLTGKLARALEKQLANHELSFLEVKEDIWAMRDSLVTRSFLLLEAVFWAVRGSFAVDSSLRIGEVT